MIGLGIDAGGTATRWALARTGESVPFARGEAGPASGHFFDPEIKRKAFKTFERICEAARGMAKPDAVVAGITGLDAASESAGLAAQKLAEICGLAASRVAVHDDLWLAYRALFKPGEGGLVLAGTGSAGYLIDAQGRPLKIGGYGLVVDDAGSGAWIAREALRAILRARDERPARSSTLGHLLYEAIGGDSWDALRRFIYASDRGALAGLAPCVADAARAGDTQALAILAAAGTELGRLGRVLTERSDVKRLALVGRAALLHPLILEALRAALPGGITIEPVEVDAAAAAARIAAASIR